MNEINNVEDVDFKEIKETEQPVQPEMKNAYRILHVQVGGNPSTEDLTTVAEAFQTALASTTSQAVTTTQNVSAFSIYEEGQAPFTGVLIRGAITVEDIARVAYEAANVGLLLAEQDAEAQQSLITTVKSILRYGSNEASIDGVFDAVVQSLKLNLPVAQSANLKQVQAWTGNTNLEDNNAWLTSDFLTLKKTNIFRYADNPAQYLCAMSEVYTNYQGPYAYFTIDAVEVEVAGVQAVDESNPAKGFLLQWKAKASAVSTPVAESDLTQEQVATIDAMADEAEPFGEAQIPEDFHASEADDFTDAPNETQGEGNEEQHNG